MFLAAEVKIYNGLWRAKQNVKEAVHEFFTTEEGDTNLISIIFVLMIVLMLAVIFRKNIASMVTAMWTQISTDASSAIGGEAIETDGFTGTAGGN